VIDLLSIVYSGRISSTTMARRESVVPAGGVQVEIAVSCR
jgi:hypothetical protein